MGGPLELSRPNTDTVPTSRLTTTARAPSGDTAIAAPDEVSDPLGEQGSMIGPVELLPIVALVVAFTLLVAPPPPSAPVLAVVGGSTFDELVSQPSVAASASAAANTPVVESEERSIRRAYGCVAERITDARAICAIASTYGRYLERCRGDRFSARAAACLVPPIGRSTPWRTKDRGP